MAERLVQRVKTRFIWFDPEDPDSLISGQEEEVYEPLDQGVSEFAGVVGSLGLPHGQAPPEPVGEWAVYRVYEKVVVWLRRTPVKEAV